MTTETQTDLPAYCRSLAEQAQAASHALASTPGDVRDAALRRIADAIADAGDELIAANALDLEAGRAAGLSDAMLDRLTIDAARVGKIAASVRQIADQSDPVGAVLEGRVLPNGIKLEKVRVPIGVILIIFESRPNVTSDAAALCLKSGNAVILRGGKEAIHSNTALAGCIKRGLEESGIDPNAVALVETPDRAAVGELLRMEGVIDLCIPRGGESLIRAVVEQAHIPVIKHYTGNCHTYVDAHCDGAMAVQLCVNAKVQRTGVCNATETILLHHRCGVIEDVISALVQVGVEVRACDKTRKLFDGLKPATEDDYAAEFLDKIVAIKTVDTLDEAIEHINRYGSKHTDAIVSNDLAAVKRFVQAVDTANAMVNCSTRFSDGGEYGLGAEIGISTDKLHARGPMGAADLCTYKWVAYGNGQTRT